MIDAKKKADPILVGTQSSKSTLPSLRQLAIAAACADAPLIAVCLIFGRLLLAVSLAGGYAISIAAAAVLYKLVEFSVAQLTGTLHGPRDAAGQNEATVKFIGLLLAKFLVVGAIAYLVFKIPGINVFGVAVGFAVAHGTVVIYSAKFSKG